MVTRFFKNDFSLSRIIVRSERVSKTLFTLALPHLFAHVRIICDLGFTSVMHVIHEREVGVGDLSGRREGPLGCRAVVRLGLGLMWGSSAVLINSSMCRSCGVGLPPDAAPKIIGFGTHSARSCSPPLNGRGQLSGGLAQPKPY